MHHKIFHQFLFVDDFDFNITAMLFAPIRLFFDKLSRPAVVKMIIGQVSESIFYVDELTLWGCSHTGESGRRNIVTMMMAAVTDFLAFCVHCRGERS